MENKKNSIETEQFDFRKINVPVSNTTIREESNETFVLYDPFFELHKVHLKKDIACIPRAYSNNGFASFLLIGRNEEKFDEEGFKIEASGNTNRFEIGANFKEFLWAIRNLNRFSPSILLCYNMSVLVPFIIFLYKLRLVFTRKKGTKFILKMDSDGILHHSPFLNFIYKVITFLNSIVFDRIITESTCGREGIAGFVNDPKKIGIVPNGYSTKDFTKIPYGEHRDPVILSVGRFTRIKGFEELIQIFSKVCQNFPEWKLVIAGMQEDTKFQEHLFRELEESEFKERISLMVNIEESKLMEYYKRASIFCSLSRIEGFSAVRIEAIASGLPILSSPAGCGRDLGGSLIVSPDKMDEGSAALSKLMSNEKLRKEISRAQQENLRTWEEVVKLF